MPDTILLLNAGSSSIQFGLVRCHGSMVEVFVIPTDE